MSKENDESDNPFVVGKLDTEKSENDKLKGEVLMLISMIL